MVNAKQDAVAAAADVNKSEVDGGTPPGTQNQAKRSWWYWRRTQNVNNTAVPTNNTSKTGKLEEKQEEKGRYTFNLVLQCFNSLVLALNRK